MMLSRKRVRRYWFALVLVATAVASPLNAWSAETIALNIAGEQFDLELAADPASRSRGLMFRRSIAPDGGMLFVFPDSQPRGFWMKNCLVDMDIVFLDDRGVVVRTLEMFAEPLQRPGESMSDYHQRLPRYASEEPAQFAIELRHGTVTRLGIARGDRLLENPQELLTPVQ